MTPPPTKPDKTRKLILAGAVAAVGTGAALLLPKAPAPPTGTAAPPVAAPAPSPPADDGGATPSPLAPWLALTDAQAAAPVVYASSWHDTLGWCLVIPETASQRLATRIAHAAADMEMGLEDRRPGTRGFYATPRRTGAEGVWWEMVEEGE